MFNQNYWFRSNFHQFMLTGILSNQAMPSNHCENSSNPCILTLKRPFVFFSSLSNYYHSDNIAISWFQANLYNYAELSEPPLDWYTVKIVINCTWLILLMKRYRQNQRNATFFFTFFNNFFIFEIFNKGLQKWQSVLIYKNLVLT